MRNRSSDGEERDARASGSGLSRRGLILGGGAAAASAASVAFGHGSAAAAAPGGDPRFALPAAPGDPGGDRPGDLLLVNGSIHTFDEHDAVVSAVRIRDGRFVAVGDEAQRGAAGQATTVDLQGRTVIPGIVDSHNHIVLVGNRPGHHVPLEDVFIISDAVARLQARAQSVPDGEFITTIGPISAMQFAERRLPNLTELDAVPRPVFLMGAQGGTVTNSLGKAFFESRGIAGIAANGTVPGSPFGTGAAGAALLVLRQEFLTPESRQRTALDTLQYYAGLGITTHLDAGAFHADPPNGAIFGENVFTMHEPFLALNSARALPARLRIDFLHQDTVDTLPTLRERLKNSFPFFGDDMLRTGGIGEFTAQGIGQEGGPVWLLGTREVAKAGWRNENHSLTQNDYKLIVQGWEQVDAEFPIGELRWVIAHVPFITEEYVLRLKALGGGLKVGWGPVRSGIGVGPAYRTILGTGIPVGYHSDGGDITVINPWLNFYTMVTGRNLRGDLINEGQTVTREEAIRLATSANTWFLREDDLGPIAVGNHADLAVLDRDFFSVPETEIPQVRSVMTIVGGRMVHDGGVVPVRGN